MISAIVATGKQNELGKDNKLLWHLPADLKFFKATTLGFPIIMGRKTYESIGRLLPNRKNIIITRNTSYRVEGAEIHTELHAALNYCKNLPEAPQKVFLIGGAEIYRLGIHQTDEIYRTLINQSFDADVFYDPINASDFKLIWQECHEPDEKNKFQFCFQKWERINKITSNQ
ncbi:MAG: dihydrofolate reductase [Sphingobacteriaceae bacterium]|nr:dihydrofolate reductase [Sphingobacteriaceae bacterium]